MKQPDMSVRLGPLALRNPVLTASGTFGYVREYADLVPPERLGGVTVKGVSPFPCEGNPPPRTWEVEGGLLNAIGLQNPGVEAFIHKPEYLPYLRTLDTCVIVNIWGRSLDDYVEVARRLEAEREGIGALEINISCPNVKEGGLSFGRDPESAAKVVAAVRAVTQLPLITKLSPNSADIVAMAQAVVEAGSDIISLINTIPAMAVDIYERKPCLGNGYGGLSGPAVRCVALRCVHQVRRALHVPIIGMGGIMTWEDAAAFLLCGADAVAVGTANFANPRAPLEILDGLRNFLISQKISSVREYVGTLQFG